MVLVKVVCCFGLSVVILGLIIFRYIDVLEWVVVFLVRNVI